MAHIWAFEILSVILSREMLNYVSNVFIINDIS